MKGEKKMNDYEAISRTSDCILAYLGDGENPVFDIIKGDYTVNETAMIHVAMLIMDTLATSKINLPNVLQEIERRRLLEDDPDNNDIPQVNLKAVKQRLQVVADRTTDPHTLDALEDIIRGLDA